MSPPLSREALLAAIAAAERALPVVLRAGHIEFAGNLARRVRQWRERAQGMT